MIKRILDNVSRPPILCHGFLLCLLLDAAVYCP
jgi:hypothetical protein